MSKFEPSVFFPWERRPLWLLGRGGRYLRTVVLVGLVLTTVVTLRVREEHKAAVRATRAAITTAHFAAMSYRADHRGKCPTRVEELVSGGYLRQTPLDAWGRPLRIDCRPVSAPLEPDTAAPAALAARGTTPAGVETDLVISSDGPDGLPYGPDRIE